MSKAHELGPEAGPRIEAGRYIGDGSEFDSLADIGSFGISPSMLAYAWVLEPFGRIGWFVAFLFVVCAAMRLA